MTSQVGSVSKAVIACGGTGGRLHEITKGNVLKIHVGVEGKPLIAHQLEQMAEIGVKEVKLLFRNTEQVREFDRFKDRYPSIECSPLVDKEEIWHIKNRHVLALLSRDEIVEWVGSSSLLFSYGDNFLKEGVLKQAKRIFNETSRSVFVSEEFTEGVNRSPAGTTYGIERAIQKNGETNYSPSFAAFITTNNMFEFLVGKFNSGARSLFPILKKAFEDGVKSVLFHANIWNVNWPIDYILLVEALKTGRFPAYEPHGTSRVRKR